VTGGCSFIGSHLVDALVARQARSIRVVDDLSTGELGNIALHVDAGRVEFVPGDLRDPGLAGTAMDDVDVVFHLAAIHGGRGFIDLHQSECAANLVLDGTVIAAAVKAGVDRLVFASSGCVYPVGLQSDVTHTVMLSEPMAGPPYDPDGIYGWAKLSTELTLEALYRERGFQSASCRLFTVYGERCHESHAILALIARAFVEQRPFEVWGDGSQIRNWTFVSDIVRGLILAAENISDASAVNLGTEEPISVMQAARLVLEMSGHDAELKFLTEMPTGPLNRVAKHERASEILGWWPEVSFPEGLRRTVEWYFATQHLDTVVERVTSGLVER
jgi:nucleoside-diphosphate-sugar epimerase